MSFVTTFKKWFNIGGVEVNFEFDGIPKEEHGVDFRGHYISKDSGMVKGRALLTSGYESKVKKIHFYLEQHIKKEKDGNEQVEIVKIGDKAYDLNLEIKPEETKKVEFEIPFEAKQSLMGNIADKVAQKGGLLGMVGSIGSFMENVQTTYTVVAKLEIEGALFKKEEAIGVKLV